MPPAVGHLIPFLLPLRTPHVMGLKLLKLLLHLGAPNYAFQSWYQDTYDQVIQDPDKDLLAPIMFTMDKTVISEASHLSVYVILFNTSIYNRDPDKREVVLRINNEQVFCQTGRRGPNRTYCVYGMGPNEHVVSEQTELFAVTNDLIIRVICAENSQLNVVDKEGNQVVAARYPQSDLASTISTGTSSDYQNAILKIASQPANKASLKKTTPIVRIINVTYII